MAGTEAWSGSEVKTTRQGGTGELRAQVSENGRSDAHVERFTKGIGIGSAPTYRYNEGIMAEHPTPSPEQAPLVALIHDRGGAITPRQLQHARRTWRASAQVAREALDALVTASLGTWQPDGQTFSLDSNIGALLELGRLEPTRGRPKREITGDAVTAEAVGNATGNGNLRGLGTIPSDWPELPSNASLQAELGWVQAHRLVVVEDRAAGGVHVHLERASEPAPSKAALGWLETSIRSYAKYIDVVARSLRDELDEQEGVKRERLRLDEIDALLAEMHEDERV